LAWCGAVAAAAARQPPVAFLFEALPDFVKLAEAYGCVGIQAINPASSDRLT